MLTAQQQALLSFIHDRLNATGVSPSFDEMKAALKLKSKSGIHRLVSALEERGFIRRLPNRARAVEVIRLPQPPLSALKPPARALKVMTSNPLPKGGFFPVPSFHNIAVPILGQIAAGSPIEAIANNNPDTISIPDSMLGQGRGDHYALTIIGDSMIEAGILDGDTVVIQRCDSADNGTIVVALVDNQEVTLKRLRRRHNSIALEPANPAYETRIFPPDRVKIQGRLVGLVRKY